MLNESRVSDGQRGNVPDAGITDWEHKKDLPTLKELARTAFRLCDGDQDKAVEMVISWFRSDNNLLMSLLDDLVKYSLSNLMRHEAHAHRRLMLAGRGENYGSKTRPLSFLNNPIPTKVTDAEKEVRRAAAGEQMNKSSEEFKRTMAIEKKLGWYDMNIGIKDDSIRLGSATKEDLWMVYLMYFKQGRACLQIARWARKLHGLMPDGKCVDEVLSQEQLDEISQKFDLKGLN